MSYIFDIDGETVWSPALRTGQVYVGYIRSLEIVLQCTAGLNAIADDMIDVDPTEFDTFVNRLIQFVTDGSNPVLAAMIEPVLATSWVMLRRSGSAPAALETTPETLRQAVERLDRDMPH